MILLDFDMPHLNGLEVLKWLRLNFSERGVPVYLLTSSDDSEDRRKVERVGATGYLFKTALYNGLIQELDQLIAITNKKWLEEATKRQEIMAELALMGEYAVEMVVLTDNEGRVEWINEPFIRVSGYTLEELRGKKPGGLLQGPESGYTSVRMLHNAVNSAHTCECQIVNYKKDGTSYPVHISLGPVFHSDRLEGFLAVQSDLSETTETTGQMAGAMGFKR